MKLNYNFLYSSVKIIHVKICKAAALRKFFLQEISAAVCILFLEPNSHFDLVMVLVKCYVKNIFMQQLVPLISCSHCKIFSLIHHILCLFAITQNYLLLLIKAHVFFSFHCAFPLNYNTV